MMLPARPRAVATGAIVAASVVALPFTADRPLATAVAAYVLVLAMGRSRLPWARQLRLRPVVRISVRLAAYALPAAVVSIAWSWSWWGSVAGIGVGCAGLLLQRENIRTGLKRSVLRLMPYERPVDRVADVLYYGGSGAAQEFLHRGLWLTATTPLLGWWAVALTAVLFVAEHLAQPSRLAQWDTHDVLWQVFLSLSLGSIVYVTGSLPAAVLGHTIYNLPYVVQSLLRPQQVSESQKETV